jgi:hypothetical protein
VNWRACNRRRTAGSNIVHLLATMRSFAPTAISYKTGKGEDLLSLDDSEVVATDASVRP